VKITLVNEEVTLCSLTQEWLAVIIDPVVPEQYQQTLVPYYCYLNECLDCQKAEQDIRAITVAIEILPPEELARQATVRRAYQRTLKRASQKNIWR